jgi:hypothetical protein
MEDIGNGVLFDDTNPVGRYNFYYKPIETSRENNRYSRRVKLDRAYKCVLKVRYLGGAAGRRLVVDDFLCRGGGGGDGKVLMCTAIKFLQEKLHLSDEAEVSLLAMADIHGDREERGKNKQLTHMQRQEKLNTYYTRTYGFEGIHSEPGSHIYGTHMSTTIGTIKDKCMAQGGAGGKRTRRRKR